MKYFMNVTIRLFFDDDWQDFFETVVVNEDIESVNDAVYRAKETIVNGLYGNPRVTKWRIVYIGRV